MWGYMGHDGGWGWMGFGVIGMWLFWILVIVVVVVLAKSVGGPGASSERRQPKTALDILNERYARGEIDKEEFATKKRDLEG
jgi:putative membrane protein